MSQGKTEILRPVCVDHRCCAYSPMGSERCIRCGADVVRFFEEDLPEDLRLLRLLALATDELERANRVLH